MKKNVFILVLCVFFVGTSFSQVKVGITGGLNAAGFIHGGEYDDEEKIGGTLVTFQAGLVADLKLTENISVVPELLFSQRGGYQKWEVVENKENTIEATITLNYVQLPVNLALYINAGKSSKLSIFAGPYAGYLLSGKGKIDTNFDGEKESQSEKIEIGSGEDQKKALDYGINAGLGYHFGSGAFLKLQYNLGLNNLNNYTSTTIKNRNIAFTVGYFF